MAPPILLCTDGSDLSIAALQAGHVLLDPAAPRIVVTVINYLDEDVLVGSGHAGPTMTPDELEAARARVDRDADETLTRAAAAVGVPDSHRVLHGDHPGRTIVDLATELGAATIVVGSRGRGGLKRAVLGSVSDHLVRNAGCPVFVIPATATDD